MMPTAKTIKKTAGMLQSAQIKRITALYAIPVAIEWLLRLFGIPSWIILLLTTPLFPMGYLYYCTKLIRQEPCGFRNLFFFFKSPLHLLNAFLAGLLPSMASIVVQAAPAFLPQGILWAPSIGWLLISTLLSAICWLWLVVLQYQLALCPDIGLRELFRSVGKMREVWLSFLSLLVSLVWKLLIVVILLLLLGGVVDIVSPIPVFVLYLFSMLFFLPYFHLCTSLFLFETLTGQPPALLLDAVGDEASPESASAEMQDAFTKLSAQFNTYEGTRSNVAPSVLGGVSPCDLIPAPDVRELAEGEELPETEDWDALFGSAESPEQEEDDAHTASKDAAGENEESEAEQYRRGKLLLESVTLYGRVSADTQEELSAKALLHAVEGLHACIRADTTVQRVTGHILKTALEDRCGYADAEHSGTAAELCRLPGGNTLRLVIRVQGNTPCTATAEIYINET